jgi:hypothetical protein
MVENEPAQTHDEVPGVGPPGTGLRAQAAVQATPKLLSVFQDPVPRSDLSVPDHFPREMPMDQRANGGAGAAVEAFEARVGAESFELVGKLWIHAGHESSFRG